MKVDIKKLLFYIIITVLIGSIPTFFIKIGDIYKQLNKPPLSPPGFLFPVVWTILFILMGISIYRIMMSKSDKKSEKASAEYHSLCNVLRKYLMEDEDVVYAVYGYDHPLTGFPVMTIKTKKTKRPRDSLLRAAQRLKEETAEFKELVEENL